MRYDYVIVGAGSAGCVLDASLDGSEPQAFALKIYPESPTDFVLKRSLDARQARGAIRH